MSFCLLACKKCAPFHKSSHNIIFIANVMVTDMVFTIEVFLSSDLAKET